jgi:hypothetical protein
MNEIAVELTAYPKFRKAELIVKIGFMKFTPPPIYKQIVHKPYKKIFFLRDPSARWMAQTIGIPEFA